MLMRVPTQNKVHRKLSNFFQFQGPIKLTLNLIPATYLVQGYASLLL